MPTALALPCFVQIGTNFNFGSGFSTVTLPAFTDLATTDFFRIVNGGTGNTAGQITGVSTKIVPPSDVLCPVGETVREDDRDRAPPRSAGAITSHKHQSMRIEDCEREWIAGVVVMVASYRELASECPEARAGLLIEPIEHINVVLMSAHTLLPDAVQASTGVPHPLAEAL
jgi:hypothetical protein